MKGISVKFIIPDNCSVGTIIVLLNKSLADYALSVNDQSKRVQVELIESKENILLFKEISHES
jgi:hypothetical protein